jgi:hypothetical protein
MTLGVEIIERWHAYVRLKLCNNQPTNQKKKTINLNQTKPTQTNHTVQSLPWEASSRSAIQNISCLVELEEP